jgi:hypothetical protein
MQRTPVNPWPWSLNLGYNQAELITGVARQLTVAGQTAVDANGAPQHPDDMRNQLSLALDNLESVLNAAAFRHFRRTYGPRRCRRPDDIAGRHPPCDAATFDRNRSHRRAITQHG